MSVETNKKAKLSEHLTSSSMATLGHSSELDGSRLSPHFTLGELTKTSAKTADKNIPSHVHIENLKRLCGWLEMLRSEYNRRYGGLSPDPSLSREGSRDQEEPIIINSGYRSEAQEDFDELLIEQSAKSLWIHFAVRPFANRHRIRLMKG